MSNCADGNAPPLMCSNLENEIHSILSLSLESNIGLRLVILLSLSVGGELQGREREIIAYGYKIFPLSTMAGLFQD